jgi:Flp pilus assembly protein TadG
LEVAVLAPALLGIFGLALLAGRFELASGAVEQASATAARAASLARTPNSAIRAADQAATASLHDQSLSCAAVRTTVDTTGFAHPPGQPAQVTAEVTCTLDLADLLPGAPGQRRITGRTVSVLDTYRSR